MKIACPDVERGPRLLMYAHDTYGLGHLRRSLAIADHLARTIPNLSTLLLTGSPVAHHFALPPGTDYVKLPSVVKTGDEQYQARELAVSPERIISLRTAVILGAALHFEPDVIHVDHAPLGMKGELLPALRHLHRARPRARLVLGLRDVLDESSKVRRQWNEGGVYAAIEKFYDRVLVYGQADIFDPIEEYAFPPSLAARTRFCGYIQREDPVRPAAALRAELCLDDAPFVLVTTGGGGDGAALEDTFLQALRLIERGCALQAVVLTGPLMANEQRNMLEERARDLPVRLLPFHADVPGLMQASALIVAMGGYNTLCEVVASARPAIIVPRKQPRQEQQIRARAFAARGLVDMLSADEATPARLAAALEYGLLQGSPHADALASWDGGGLARIASDIAANLPAHADRLAQVSQRATS